MDKYFSSILMIIVLIAAACALPCRAADLSKAELLFEDSLALTEGIATCPDGSLYVVENGNGILYRIKSDTELEKVQEGFKHPAGLACDADNNLYVLEYGTGDIHVLPLGEEGGEARVLSGFTTPNAAIVASDGTLYVAESDPGRVVTVDADGNITELVDGMQHANGMAFNDDESILYINATLANKIFMTPLTGEHKGKKKTFQGKMQMVDGLVRDADGAMYACLFATGKVVRIGADGEVATLASGLSSPASPAIHNGALYVTSLQGKGINKIPLPDDSDK